MAQHCHLFPPLSSMPLLQNGEHSMLLERKRKPALFLKILSLCMLLTALVSLFLSSLLYVNYEKSIASQNAVFIAESLEKSVNSVSFMSDWARTHAIQTLYDNDIVTLLSYPSVSQNNVARLRNRIRSIRLSSPYLVSLYVYNGTTKRIYSDFGNQFEYPEEGFYDQDILPYLKTVSDDFHLMPLPRRVDYTLDGTVRIQADVYTYILYENPRNRKANDNIIVLNIARQWLDHAFRTLGATEENQLLVVDSLGTVTYGNESMPIGTSLAADPIIDNILAQPDPVGYLISGKGRERAHVTWVRDTSEDTDWTFVYQLPISYLTRDIGPLQRTTVMLSLVALFIGLVGSFAYAVVVYRPINRIQNRLKQLESSETTRREELQHAFLKTLFQAGGPQENLLLQEADELGINLPTGKFTPLLVIEDHAIKIDQLSHEAQQQLHRNLSSLLEEHFGTNANILLLEPHTFAILAAETENLQFCHERLKSVIENAEIQAATPAFCLPFSYSISAVCGRCVEGYDDLPATWLQMKNALVARLFEGPGCLIDMNACSPEQKVSTQEAWQMERQLSQRLLMRDIPGAIDVVSALLEQSKGALGNQFHIAMLRIVSVLMDTVDKLNVDRRRSIHIEVEHLLGQSERFESLEDVLDVYRAVFGELHLKMGSDKTTDHMTLVDNIKTAVRQRYGETALTIDSFTNLTELSGIHLSRIFRRLTGESFADYLRNVRLHEACTLLRDTRFSIQEIAMKTGFPNPNHFYTLFRKEKGCTPGLYRKTFPKRKDHDVPDASPE